MAVQDILLVLTRSRNLDLAAHMTSSPNQWYVQTDFGALLGPMPAEALSELARTGALLHRDQVREGPDGDWRLASELPDLLEEAAQKARQPDTLQESASPRASFKIASSARLLDDLMKSKKDKGSQQPVTPTAKPVTELDFEVDVPLIAPKSISTTPPVAASRAVDEIKTQSTPIVASQPRPIEVAVPAPPPQPMLSAEPPPTDRMTDWESPAFVPVRRLPTTRKPSPSPDRRRRWLPVATSVTVALMLATVWWVWPRQRPDIYSRYVAIYKELQERRDKPQDQTGWSEFAQRANAQLDEVLPWLEDNAKPGDREKSLLLYAGRDLHDLLRQPRDSQLLHQKRLNAFFDQLQEMYGSRK
jgi:hypothetical protein